MTQQIVIQPSKDTTVIDINVDVQQSIIVTPPPVNIHPNVSAGQAQTIKLPTASINLIGAATDPDGTVVSSTWVKTSGGAATIQTPTTLNTVVSGLVEGSYVFTLTAIDNSGDSSSSSTTITVQPADVIVVPPPIGYTLLYSNGYDKTTDLDTVHQQLGLGTISTTITKDGTGGSFKSIVNVAQPAISSGFRSENQYGDAAQNPKEGAVEYDVYFDSWQSPGWGGSSIQWHPSGNDNGGSALFFLETAQQNFNVYAFSKGYQDGYQAVTKIIPKKWYHIRWEFKWSLNTDGYFRIFIDGVLYWSLSGKTQISSDQPYLKVGQNFFSGSSNQSTSVHGGIIYYDNLKVYKKS